MKKLVLSLFVLVPLVISAAALAAPNPAGATAHCKALLKSAPASYASLGACLKAQDASIAQNTTAAEKACKAEQDAGATAFANKYGTGNKKNALGKCVSSKADAATVADQAAELNAAKKCKAERTSLGATAFATKYGTNANKKNAFGKCVSKLAKAQQS